MFNILATFEGHPEMAQFSSVSLSLIGSIPLIVALIFLLNGVKSLCTTKAESHCLEVSQSSGAV